MQRLVKLSEEYVKSRILPVILPSTLSDLEGCAGASSRLRRSAVGLDRSERVMKARVKQSSPTAW